MNEKRAEVKVGREGWEAGSEGKMKAGKWKEGGGKKNGLKVNIPTKLLQNQGDAFKSYSFTKINFM